MSNLIRYNDRAIEMLHVPTHKKKEKKIKPANAIIISTCECMIKAHERKAPIKNINLRDTLMVSDNSFRHLKIPDNISLFEYYTISTQ